MMFTPRNALVTLAVAVMLAGCGGIPSSGPVERVSDDGGPDQSTVRYAPVGPSRGASPQQIVRGFLDAMLAYPVSTGTAALYLTPDAAKRWRSSQGVTVYTSPEVSLSETPVLDTERESIMVDLRTSPVARLDRQGHFTKGGDGRPRSFVLEKIKGQWRISNPQDGVMVTRTYYDDYFRPFSLYFFDAPGERVVPDLVHLAVGEQLPTALVTALARGPVRTPGSLRTYMPGVGSLRPSVTVGDADVADVEFSASLTNLSTGEQERLAAQIVWTLRSVPALVGVRIFGGTPILSARGDRVHAIDSWGGFGPPAGNAHTYALVGDKLVEIDGTTVRPVKGAWGRDAIGAVEVAVGDDSVAAVLPGRDRVRITDRGGGSPLDVDGARFIAPRWDPDGRLWLIDRPARATRVRIVDDDSVRNLPARGVRGMAVRSFALSPDGARYALTGTEGGGPSIYVGPVHRDRDGRLTALGNPQRLDVGVGDPRSVGWISTTRFGFLGASDAGVQRYEVAYDGTDLTGGDTGGGPLLPDVDAESLAGRTGENAARWVLDARRRLWYLPPDGSWRLVDDRRFSGLSTGD
jgi:Lipoprotein LpqB beta-propeller domain/Sporulation and spore germination